jgi:hypothetical protein
MGYRSSNRINIALASPTGGKHKAKWATNKTLKAVDLLKTAHDFIHFKMMSKCILLLLNY